MISFIQLPYRRQPQVETTREVGPAVIAAVLLLLLAAQIGLVLWVFFRQWLA